MTGYAIAHMRAIGPDHAAKLKAAGIRTTATLLERARSPRRRRKLAHTTGIPDTLILTWANMADLTRVHGIALDYAELLEAAGVDTVKALKRRNAANLAARMAALNVERNIVQVSLSEKRVASWIEAAQSLPPVITYRSDTT
jgi:hypothetical protein